jgi:hypothetical protein
MASPALPVALVGAGAYLAWFGVHYWRTDVAWPSDPVKAVLTGKGLPSGNKSAAANITTPVATNPDVTGAIGDLGGGAAGPGTGFAHGTLSKAQIASLWTANGGDPGKASLAAAIAMAESSGRIDATSSNPDGGTNVGLWQLDTRGVGAGYTVAQLQSSPTNARVAVLGSANGTNWSEWQTYVQGTYRQFL